MVAKPVALVDEIRTLAFGAITPFFTALGSSLSHQARIFRLVNTTDALLSISFDGASVNLILPAGSFVLYDLTTNRDLNLPNLVLQEGTQFFVRFEAGPTLGAVYLEVIYAKGE